MRLHSYLWNQKDREYTTVILTTTDIESGNFINTVDIGFELLIVPIKYKDIMFKFKLTDNESHLVDAMNMAEFLNGKIVFV